jgi:hypothetical protein
MVYNQCAKPADSSIVPRQCLIGACTILNLSKTQFCSATKESASRGSLWVGAIATIASIGGLVFAISGALFAAILPLTVIMRCLQGASYGAFNSAGMLRSQKLRAGGPAALRRRSLHHDVHGLQPLLLKYLQGLAPPILAGLAGFAATPCPLAKPN